MRKALFVFVLVLLCSVQLFAQDAVPTASPVYQAPVQTETKTPPKQIIGGVLNGKATSLPKPTYPPAARSVNASGPVTVQVLIDEMGNVIGASAVSGHPLLRAAAVEAAREAKFSPTRLQGNPVKVSGVIVYNFVGSLYPARLAFILSHAERTGMFGKYGPPSSLASRLPKEWVEEREALDGLTYDEVVPPNMVVVGDSDKLDDSVPKADIRKTEEPKPDSNKAEPLKKEENRYALKTVKGEFNYSAAAPDRKLDARSVSAVQNLLTLIERRVAPASLGAWNLQVGRALGAIAAEAEDRSKLLANLSTIDSLLQNIPVTSNLESVQHLREFVEFAKAENVSAERIAEIRAKAESVSNLRY
jgi:TonB family protein